MLMSSACSRPGISALVSAAHRACFLPVTVGTRSSSCVAPRSRLTGLMLGRAVREGVEHGRGHALAAFGYGAMSRPAPSAAHDPWADVPPHLHPLYASNEQLAAQGRREFWERVEAKHTQDAKRPPQRRYVDV